MKTKYYLKISKLNYALESAKADLSTAYRSLGEAYFEKKDEIGFQALLSEEIKAVEQALNEIEMVNSQLNEVKGIRVCPKCKSNNPVAAMFCNKCGEKLPEPENRNPIKAGGNSSVVCSSCGKILPADALYCSECGAKTKPKKTSNIESWRECPKCGIKLPIDDVFCYSCGQSIKDSDTGSSGPNTCISCGTILPETAAFCPVCGSKISETDEEGNSTNSPTIIKNIQPDSTEPTSC